MKDLQFITSLKGKKSLTAITEFIFDSLAESVFEAKLDDLERGQWKHLADCFTVLEADEFDWTGSRGALTIFLGSGLVQDQPKLAAGSLAEHKELEFGQTATGERILQLSKYKDARSLSEIEQVKGHLHKYYDAAKGDLPFSTMTETLFVMTPQRLDDLIRNCRLSGEMCFDFETRPRYPDLKKAADLKEASLDFKRSLPTMLGISFQVGSGWIIPMYHHESVWNCGMNDMLEINNLTPEKTLLVRNGEVVKNYHGAELTREADPDFFDIVVENLRGNIAFAEQIGSLDLLTDYVIPKLNEAFMDRGVRKVAQNLKFDYKIGKEIGLNFIGRLDDTRLMDHYIREDREHGLKEMAARYFPEFTGYEEGIDYAGGPLRELGEYCAKDNDLTLRIAYILEKELLKDARVYRCYRNLETEKTRILAEMEYKGMQLNIQLLEENIRSVNEHIKLKEDAILSHPTVRRFIAAKTLEKAQEEVKELEEKLEKFKAEKLETLLEKSPKLKEGTKAKAKAENDSAIRLLKAEEWYDPNFPYAKVKEWAAQLLKLQTGQYGKFEFNLKSTQQLGELIYLHPQGLCNEMPESTKVRKSKVTGRIEKVREINPDTSKDYLAQLPDPSGLIANLMELNVLQGLKGTFLEGIRETMDRDGVVHSSFSTIRSQRLSSSNPNLQNIQSRTNIKEVKEAVASIKRMFISHSKREDVIFFQADLSQAELRWAAHLWNVRSMKDAFVKGIDLHVLASCNSNNMSLDEYWELKKTDKDKTDKLRYEGKANNFGFLYGMGPKSYLDYAKMTYGLTLTLKQAERQYQSYLHELHPDIPKAHKLYEARASKYGYVRTAFGAKRHTPNINDLNPQYRSADARVAVNSPIQGSSGQGLVFSLVIFYIRAAMYFGYRGDFSDIAAVINSVHDSSIGWVVREIAKEYLKLLADTMNNPPTIDYFGFDFEEILMKTDVEIGANWKDLEKFDFNEN